MKVTRFPVFFFGLLALTLVLGCGDGSSGNPNAKPPTAEEIEQQIKEVEADPNMPDQAKAMRIQMLRQNGGSQGSNAPQEGKESSE